MFFAGATNVLLAMAWWAAWLVHARYGNPPAHALPLTAGLWHALVMLYQVLPPFMFGFLLTTFPRWMGLPDVPRWRYLPAGACLIGGQWLTLIALASGHVSMLVIGWAMSLLGFAWGAAQLALKLMEERRARKGPTWHAWSCFAGIAMGVVGSACTWVAALQGDIALAQLAVRIGLWGLLLPVYLSVAHRMFPFFANNVVAGYAMWRPMWLLAAVWAGCIAHLLLETFADTRWTWLADLPFAALLGFVLWRWWPRAQAPGLLWVLFVGFLWLPVAVGMYGIGSVLQWFGEAGFGRAPAHALTIGFFGSVLVAMVTRVTQGHSGQPLHMPKTAWFTFAALQVVAVARILGEFMADAYAWHAAAAIGWVLAFLPWTLRNARIYLRARSDGKPG